MRPQSQHSLTGKARRVHHRNRAARLSAQQQIDETIQSDAELAVVHLKPPKLDRSQREFIPSADPAFDIAVGGQQQLELAFGGCDEDAERTHYPSGHVTTGREGPVASPPCAGGPRVELGEPRAAGTDRPRPFTLGGLLYGCLIGGAAAGVILVFLRALIL